MTSNTDLVLKSGVLETCISDHFLVYALLNLKLPKPPPSYICARTYRNYDAAEFNDVLSRVQWDQIYFTDDVNEKLKYFNDRFLKIFDQHAPIKNMKIRNRQCPFINEEVKHLKRNMYRGTLHNLARTSGLAVDWERYRSSRKMVKLKLREAEGDFIKSEIENSKKKQSIWKTISLIDSWCRH
ncbi:uncharacterized protein [Montipora capricornis]|uniref:uncharacterized protein n=1 Tax=Montipora capricornis TaxID=246305 RepID=UPI0035F15A55